MGPHPDALAPAPIDPAGHEAHLSKGKEKPVINDAPELRREGADLDLGLLGQKIALAGMSNMVSPFNRSSSASEKGKYSC